MPYKILCRTGRTGAKVHATKSHQNECTRSDPLDPELTFWCVSYYLGAFGTLWLPYNTQCKTGQTGAKVRATKSRWNFSNEHNRSTPLDPKLIFWCVSYYSGAFGTVWLPYKTRCKTVVMVQKFVPRSRVGIFLNERGRSTPLDPKLTFCAFRTIWVHSGAFGCLTKLDAKRVELVQTFVPRSRIGIYHNERSRSTPLDPKLIFWFVLYHLGAFGTFWLPYETRCKSLCHEVASEFFATKAPDPHHWTLN